MRRDESEREVDPEEPHLSAAAQAWLGMGLLALGGVLLVVWLLIDGLPGTLAVFAGASVAVGVLVLRGGKVRFGPGPPTD